MEQYITSGISSSFGGHKWVPGVGGSMSGHLMVGPALESDSIALQHSGGTASDIGVLPGHQHMSRMILDGKLAMPEHCESG